MEKLQVNVSGGRTSAYMAWWLKEVMYDHYDMLFIFANTGQEHEDTLRFVNDVDRNFNLGLVWVEADVQHDERKRSGHKVTDYYSASRNGEPFEEVIKKYGVCNHTHMHCTREMKKNAIDSYTRSVWGDEDFSRAIGIRADEKRRVSVNASKQKIVYPLVDMMPVDKEFILDWWKNYDWDLKIPEHLGNCVTCYKKSDKKLNQVYRACPEAFDFFKRMEDEHSNDRIETDGIAEPRVFYRGYRSTETLLKQFATADMDTSKMFREDETGGCSESCEPFQMEIPI
jgi:hypothetical protein